MGLIIKFKVSRINYTACNISKVHPAKNSFPFSLSNRSVFGSAVLCLQNVPDEEYDIEAKAKEKERLHQQQQQQRQPQPIAVAKASSEDGLQMEVEKEEEEKGEEGDGEESRQMIEKTGD